MRLSQPKQFEMLNGKTILEHSVDTFEKHPLIHGIYVVVHEDFIENTRRLLYVRNRPKIIDIIAGGEERMDSSFAAISAINDFIGTGYEVRGTGFNFVEPFGVSQNTPRTSHLAPRTINLLIHDAARPFVSEKIITRTVEALKNHSAVSVAIPATDTIYLCNNENKIESSPKREHVYHAQTPQAARLSIFREAFELASLRASPLAKNDNQHIATDDANVILNYLPNEKIHIVLGDVTNRKITFQSDL